MGLGLIPGDLRKRFTFAEYEHASRFFGEIFPSSSGTYWIA